MSRQFMLQRAQRIERPVGQVFDFFGDACNLERLTPPWLRFKIVTDLPIEMREGTEIRYRLRLHGVPVSWTTRITAWEPNRYFVDEQISGPYQSWVHEHRFEQLGGATLMSDDVRYRLPLATLLHSTLVRPDLERIFDHRARVIDDVFGAKTREKEPARRGATC